MRNFIRLSLTFFFSIIAVTPSAFADKIAISGGKIVAGSDAAIIENGTVLVSGKRIIAVGSADELAIPDGYNLVDATGKWVTTGLIAAYSRVGLVEVSLEKSTNDTRAGDSPFSAALMAADSFNPKSENVGITRIEGITRLAILPDTSSTIFGGRGAITSTTGEFDSISDDKAFVFVEMGEGGAAAAGGSRSAAWIWLRQAMIEARSWRRNAASANPLLSNADALALQMAINDRIPFMIHVERASDILKVLEFKREFHNLNVILVGATEAWLVAEQIKASSTPVIVDPHDNLPQGFETLGATMHNAKRLQDAGVLIAIADLHDENFNTRLMPQHAGNTLATGMKWEDAFAAITINPARIYRIDEELGSLEVGKLADIVVWDGDPLELMSSPDVIYIAGAEQSLQSRQTKLRDRYLGVLKDTDANYGYD